MKIIFLFSVFFLLIACNKPKTVMICGDHVCINKKEAKQYFEENLTIEVKIVDKKIKKSIDLVELNLKESLEGKAQVNVYSKSKTNNEIKTLSSEEIKKIKTKLNAKQKNKKNTNKSLVNKKKEKIKKIGKVKKTQNKEKKNIKFDKKNVNKKRKEVVDICTIIEKCSIEEISKYLLKEGNKKDFPDITSRQ